MHSDPFLTSLIAKNPKLEREIYELFLEYEINDAIVYFSNTPTWALTRLFEIFQSTNQGSYMYSSIFRHENFDLSLIDQFIVEKKDDYFSFVHNPNVGRERLIAVSQSGAESYAAWAKYYLYKDTPEIEELLMTELKKDKVEDILFIAAHIIRDCKLPESCVETLMESYLDKVLDKYREHETVGAILSQNPNLTNEQRAAMHLMGYTFPAPAAAEPPFLPSSRLFPIAHYKYRAKPDQSLLQAIAAEGHPVTAIDEDYKETVVEINELNLSQLIQAEYLHRALWTELEGVDDFQLTFRNGYRVMDLFISHETLGEAFENSDYDDGHAVGGVLAGYEDRSWISTDQTIDPERAADLLIIHGESWDEIIYGYESLSELYPPALAHFASGDTCEEYIEKYGVTLTESAEDVIVNAACESADQEEFDVEPSFSTIFDEKLSWEKLSISKKEQIFALLKCGLASNNSELKGDAEHLLGCIALHPGTPEALVNDLQSLGNELITATLARRSA